MPTFAYERLGFLDSSFILGESRTNHMHVGGVAIFDVGSLRTPDGGIDIERIRAFVDAKLSRLPRYRQVVSFVPITRHPVWVDDPHFNIHYHVRHLALPRPGHEQQLKRLSGWLMSQQLDRRRPLWELWIIEGLDGGDRFAIIAKIHHAMMDGVSGVGLITALLAPEPMESFAPAEPQAPRPAPTGWELLQAEARRHTRSEFASSSPRERREHGQGARSDVGVMVKAARDLLKKTIRRASSTPLNQPIGPQRRFDWLRMDLEEMNDIRRALGGSLNDLILAIVTFAVRSFLERRGVDVDSIHFRVMAPVNTRAPDQRAAPGNQFSGWVVDLPLSERDPRRCVARIQEMTQGFKKSHQARGAEMLNKAISGTPSILVSLGARMMTRALPFNMIVTNIPGPQAPHYLLGARMLDTFGLIPLTDYLALGIVLFSYAGQLTWGFNADWDLVPDLHEIVLAAEEAFRGLRHAAGLSSC